MPAYARRLLPHFQAVKAAEAQLTVRIWAKRSKFAARKEIKHWSDTVPGFSFQLSVLSEELFRARLALNAAKERVWALTQPFQRMVLI